MIQGQRQHGVRLRQNVKSQYVFKERLGSGTHGVVHLAVERSTGLLRAVKKIRKKPGLDIIRFKRELEVLMNFRHPQIVKVYEAFEDCNALYIIMEYCKGGDLCDRLETEGAFPESAAAYFMRQALGAVSMCHENGIMHRDIKLENFLFTNKDARSPLKLTDFGLCRYFEDKSDPPSLVGTISYLAPEVLNLSYDHSADLWSLGVLLYMLIMDDFPFGRTAQTETDVLREIKNGVIHFPSGANGIPSARAQDLIRGLCQIDPGSRLSAKQALKHPWITALSPPPLQYLPILFSCAPKIGGSSGTLSITSESIEESDAGIMHSNQSTSPLRVRNDDKGELQITRISSIAEQRIIASVQRDPPTVQQFLQLVQAESKWSKSKEVDVKCSSPATSTLGVPLNDRSGTPASSPSISHSRERSMAIAHQLQNEMSAASSASSISVRASEPNFEGSSEPMPRGWASAMSMHEGVRCSVVEDDDTRTFCCDMLELCSRHSKRCTKAANKAPEENAVAMSRRAGIGECIVCDSLRRVTTAIRRLGVTSASSASALGHRLVERWKAFRNLSPTERNVLSMIARQMDTSELTYFGCLYELLDCDRTGNISVEPLARAVAYIYGCEKLVCHTRPSSAPEMLVLAEEKSGADVYDIAGRCRGKCQQFVPAMATLAAITSESSIDTPTKGSSVSVTPVSPATAAPISSDRADNEELSAADLYANDLSYISEEMRICEYCTPAAAFSSYVQLLDELRTLLHTHIDLNHNGKIEVDEFSAACMDQLLVLKPIASKILFKSLNVHHTQTVTVDEFKSAFGDTTPPDNTVMNSVDPDGDGQIEETDLEALLCGSAACLSRGSRARLCEENKECNAVLDATHPRDSMDFRHLMPKLSPAR